MISFLLYTSSFFNFTFFIFAVGFVIAFGLEQILKVRPLSFDSTMNERNMYIVQNNRKYCWRQAWVANLMWFLCNVVLYFLTRNIAETQSIYFNGL